MGPLWVFVCNIFNEGLSSSDKRAWVYGIGYMLDREGC